MIKTSLYKVKDSKLCVWSDWCDQLSSNLKSEALDTLKEENSFREIFLSFNAGEVDYVLGLSEFNGESLKPNQIKDINKTHQQKKEECLTYVGTTSLLLDLKI